MTVTYRRCLDMVNPAERLRRIFEGSPARGDFVLYFTNEQP